MHIKVLVVYTNKTTEACISLENAVLIHMLCFQALTCCQRASRISTACRLTSPQRRRPARSRRAIHTHLFLVTLLMTLSSRATLTLCPAQTPKCCFFCV